MISCSFIIIISPFLQVQAGINEGMKKKIGDMIPLKLQEKGIDVDCVACFTEDQADFFFDMLEQLGISSAQSEDDF